MVAYYVGNVHLGSSIIMRAYCVGKVHSMLPW